MPQSIFSRIWKSVFAILAYFLVNGLFVVKYSPNHGLFYMLGYGAIILTIIGSYLNYSVKLLGNKKSISKKIIFLVSFLILVGIFIVKSKFNPLNINDDRWSALYNWSAYFLQGKYPYAAQTHLGQYASPFPIWEIIHLPFFLLKDEIYAHILLLIILLFFLYKYSDLSDGLFYFLLLAFSPAYWWEVLVRSDLMNNLTVSLIFIVLCEKVYLQRPIIDYKMLGLLVGLLLCTRLFLIFPFGIYFISKLFKWDKENSLSFIFCALIGCIVPFIPFAIWNWDMLFHFKYNPIYLQTQLGSPFLALIGIVILGICSFLWKSFDQYIFCSGMVLFLFICLRFVQAFLKFGWNGIILEDDFDISYFNVCLPFVIFYISLKPTPKKI